MKNGTNSTLKKNRKIMIYIWNNGFNNYINYFVCLYNTVIILNYT